MKIDCSSLFCNCLGVFQGGGCKAIAYVGAYEVAKQNGIGFSHVAGTSAGAIFAALIAAGATPEQLIDIAQSDEIKKITVLQKSIKWWIYLIIVLIISFVICVPFYAFSMNYIGLGFLIILGMLGLRYSGVILGLIYKFGIYDSRNIELTLNGWLNQILKFPDGEKTDVKFKDLPLNLTVFSCNVTDKKVQKWSLDDSPDLSVAKAVAASCSIPIYFSPIKIDDKYYVDGGMLINRPDIIYDNFPNYFQALSFKLNTPDSGITNVWSYIKALLGTLIEGADALQHTPRAIEDATFGHDGVNNVEINIGSINATDFKSLTKKRVDDLLQKGRDAMTQFIADTNAMLESDDTNVFTTSANRIITEEDYVLNQVAFWSNDECDQIIVADETLDWVWPLFPTIVSWFNNRISVIVHYSTQPDNQNDIEKHSAIKRLLDAFGITHTYTSKDELIKGYFFLRDGKYKCILFDRKISNGKEHFSAKLYNSKIDSIFISSIIKKITAQHIDNNNGLSPITINSVDANKVISLIAEIEVYKSLGVKESNITYRRIAIKDLSFLKKEVRSLKYKELRILSDLFKKADVELYSPAAIVLPNGQLSIMTPILAEKHNDRYVVIKGNARCLRLYQEKGEDVDVPLFVVESSLQLDNRTLYPIYQLYLSEKKNRGKVWLDPIRRIDQAMRPNISYLVKNDVL